MLFSVRSWIKRLGPGITTGAADDDPSGIATYAQSGAAFGSMMFWPALLTLPFLISIQEMCARVALTTGRGIIGNVCRRFPRDVVWILVILLIFANTINIAADLGMMAAALNLVAPIPIHLGVLLMGGLALLLQITVSYSSYARILRWLTLSLFAYVLTAFIVVTDWPAALRSTIHPTFVWRADAIAMLIAFVGTTLSPYLYLWQANQEVEEEKRIKHIRPDGHAHQGPSKREIRSMRWDVWIGMTVSNIVAWCIVVLGSSLLFRAQGIELTSVMQLAELLAPIAGPWASLLFLAGIIGTGMLAVPILSGTIAYAVTELRGCASQGIGSPWKRAHLLYGTIVCIMIAGMSINLLDLNPIRMLIFAAICNGIVAPILLLAIWHIANDRTLMHQHANGWLSNTVTLGSILLLLALPVMWLLSQ